MVLQESVAAIFKMHVVLTGISLCFRVEAIFTKKHGFNNPASKLVRLASSDDPSQSDNNRDLDWEHGYSPQLESDIPTKVSLLSQETEQRIIIEKVGGYGFTLSTGETIMGPAVFLPKHCFSWKVIDYIALFIAHLLWVFQLAPWTFS